MDDLIILAGVVGVYYLGRAVQWARGRTDRKTSEAIEHISDVLKKHNDKRGENG